MFRGILKLEGVKKLDKNHQKSIIGGNGFGSCQKSYLCPTNGSCGLYFVCTTFVDGQMVETIYNLMGRPVN